MKRGNMNYRLFIILLVAVIIITGCVSKNKETVVIPTQTLKPTITIPTPTITLCEKKCNEICYDPSKQSCCFGTILDGKWREESSDRSCNNLNFKSTNIAYEEWYCGGVRYHLNEDISCCNGTSYNDDTNHCNKGKIEAGKVISTQEQQKYSRTLCGSTSCPNGFFCCNNACYDPLETNTGYCCGGSPCTKGWGCCAGKCYNPANSHCCGSSLCPIGWGCCRNTIDGDRCYDIRYYECITNDIRNLI